MNGVPDYARQMLNHEDQPSSVRVASEKLSDKQIDILRDLIRQRDETEISLAQVERAGSVMELILYPLDPSPSVGKEQDMVRVLLALPSENVALRKTGSNLREVVGKMLYEQLCSLTTEIRNIVNS